MNIHNKTIVITGAGSGIGRALALLLLKKNANVAAVDLNEKSLAETKKLAYEQAHHISTHVVNITDWTAVETLPNALIAQHGNIDGLINNAGIIQPFIKVNTLDYEAINRVMSVNFFGAVYMIKTFLPLLLKRPEAHITNISSMGGFLPVPGQSFYGASKAAIKLLTEGLYAELKDTNVHVSVAFPGATNTNISANSGVNSPNMPAGDTKKQNIPMQSAQTAAKIILDGMEKNKFQIFVGRDSKMMNFLYRLSPVYATNLIAKKMRSLLPE
ncbi:MAG: SDR family NAD(P)-dependent oxidoreductase [Patescibacteria group bacterium]|nr:SDR family NAD(P)-dependent oxidoreductase [Patescibacteria group bacterium]MDD5715921.1 SDR family NAD(P)-dependent oxidoreductase [Patescibacteria group bacterium]